MRVNLNQATWEELQLLEGIGELTAEKIIADRDSNGPYSTIDDLQRVSGIGPKTVEKLRPFLDCED
ncbi:MAG: helix-hairpin-helix domain-containing protein [Planctomycetaceae bacterium]|nr:helix-hairpin-helix domain-containing protein [Planctomycetaceae bacterium]